MLLDIRAALATAKTTAAGTLHAGRCFRPFGGCGFDSLGIDIVADAMDHATSLDYCERLSIALRMTCSDGKLVTKALTLSPPTLAKMLNIIDIMFDIINLHISIMGETLWFGMNNFHGFGPAL